MVTSSLPLLEELTQGGRTALLARPGDADDLAAQVVRLLRDPDLGPQQVAAQHTAMADRFDENRLLDRYIDVYARAAERPRPQLRAARPEANGEELRT